MKICIECKNIQTVYLPKEVKDYACAHPECRSPVNGLPRLCDDLRKEFGACGVDGRYYQEK